MHAAHMQLAEETTCHIQRYQLPDGRTLALGAPRFMAPEALFSPELISSDSPGLSELVFACIQASLLSSSSRSC